MPTHPLTQRFPLNGHPRSGMTRMTLTLAAILVEVADDVQLLPSLMVVLTISHLVGEMLSESFDHMMIEEQGLPFLHERPPQYLSMLTARNAMVPLSGRARTNAGRSTCCIWT